MCLDFQCAFEFASSTDELNEILSSLPEDESLAMVVSDQMMPGIRGIELIEQLKDKYPHIVSVLLTGHAELDSAKYAINRQLLDQYILKPIEEIQVFASVVANLLKCHHLDLEEDKRTEQLSKAIIKLRISNEEISAMRTAAEEIAMLSKSVKSLDLDKVISVVSREVPKIFRADRAVLCFGDDKHSAEIVCRENCPCPITERSSSDDIREPIEDNIVYCDDGPNACARLGGESPDLIIPVSMGEDMTDDNDTGDQRGYLCMCNINPDIVKDEGLIKYKASLASEILSASLTNAKLYQQAKRDSETDLLTGAGSRRVMEEKLQEEYDRAIRYEHTFSIIILDIDRFKRVNDDFGHAMGDQMLRQLSDILRQEIRKTDTLVRYGGDEFFILMPNIGLENALNTAERIRLKAEATLNYGGKSVTISCGVAEWSGEESENGTEVLRNADAALYTAKSFGRNNVQIKAVV